MNATIVQRLAVLRGAMGAEEPGARGIERLARNPACFTLKALTIAGIKPSTAAGLILGAPEPASLSPFAMLLGNQFERRMLESDAAMLFTLFREQHVLSETESRIANVVELAPGGSWLARRQRETETRRLLGLKRRGHRDAPNLIIKPRVLIEIVGVPHAIEPDFLVAANDNPFYHIGELKSTADREGKTRSSEVRSACRQAAVGVVALRQEMRRAGVRSPDALIASQAHLVFRGPGSLNPRLNIMPVEGEVDSLERALADAPRDLDELETLLSDGSTLDDPSVLSTLPHRYRESCKEHCDLWKVCRGRALAAGDLSILGDQAAEQLAPAGSMSRALELMKNRGAPSRSPAEEILAAQLQETYRELRKAVGNG